jgi:outer membrane receptor protein involved in Fe transport
MKLLSGCFLASFFLLLCGNVVAQNKLSAIQGQLVLQKDLIVEAATVTLIALRDSANVNHTALNKDGVFRFNNIAPGDYVVRITHVGFLKYVSAPIKIDNSPLFTLPPVTLVQSPSVLKEVTVVNQKAYIETKPDRTILNVEKGIMASGASVLEVLNSAPGVRVRSGEEVLFAGGQKAAIAINGRVVNLSPQDIAAQLQNMQSAGVSQIEIIPNPSGKYDAGGSGGLINIVLKKGQNNGFNGSFDQMVGYGDFFKMQSAISMNYRTKSLNFFGTYGFRDNTTDHTIITDRNVGTTTNFDVNYHNHQNTYNNNYNMGIDYNIDAAHTLGLLVVGYYYNAFLDKNNISTISDHSVNDSVLTTASQLNRRINNINYNLNYSGKLGQTNQTLAADADFNIYNRNSDEHLISDLYNIHSAGYAAPQYFTNNAPTRITNLSGRADYVDPVSAKIRIEAGLKSIYVKSDNSQYFNNVLNGVQTPENTLSSRFIYTENITSAYVNYMATLSKKIDFQVDLRAEHTESNANTISDNYEIKRSYTDLFPVVVLNYNPNADNRFSLSYNRRIDRPSYQELNPIIAYQDKYDFTTGNAYLRPAYSNKIELSHRYKSSFTTSFYASFITDAYHFTYFSQNDATGVYTAGKANLKTFNTYGVTVSLPLDPYQWWHLDFNADADYQYFADYAGLLNKGAMDAIFNLSQQFQLPGGLSLSVNGQYEIPNFYTIYKYQSIYFFSGGIRKPLLNKAATLSFTVEDAFNTERDRYSSTYSNLSLSGYDKKETKIFKISFSYKFGRNVSARKHVNGNSDDLKRLIVN